MVNRRRSTKLTLAVTLLLLYGLAGLSNANSTSSALPTMNESQPLTYVSSQNASPISPDVLEAINNKSSIETELKILKEKNTLIADFQSSLISIVTWSLTAVVSIVILLLGASLFTNFKLHEKDIQRIQLDYEAKIRVFRSEIESNLAKTGQEIATTQEARSQQDLDRMLDQASQVRSQFETVRLSLEERFDNLLSGTAKFEAKIGSLETAQIALRSELRKAETRIWEIKKIPENVLISALRGLDDSLESGQKWRVQDFIKQLKHILEADFMKPGGAILDEELQNFIEKRLIKLESEYPEDVIEVRRLSTECMRSNPDVSKS